MISLYPLLMKPAYKDYLWGGLKLKTEYGKTDGPDIIAESWELADHLDGSSIVNNGPLSGKTLGELAQIDRERIWGTKYKGDRFPVMVKLIDAKEKLSVQIHPSDECAIADNNEFGKAELWYIIDCERKAYIYLGLKKHVSRNDLTDSLRNGTICELLNKVYVNKGDVFFVYPRTIHAIGSGVVIAEIQQNSNTTFRLYDYNRKDKNGNYRTLHLKRALEIADIEATIPGKCRSTGIMNFEGFNMMEMYEGEQFRAYKVDIFSKITLFCDGTSFQHILCVEGKGHIIHQGRKYEIEAGTSYLMPAAANEYGIKGECRVLLSRL